MEDLVRKETMIISKSGKVEKSQTIEYTIYFLFGLIEILFVFRLIFKLTGANPDSSFVTFIYAITQLFIMPFTGIFPQATSQGAMTTAIFEPAILVGMVVYAVLAWGITQIEVIMSRKQQ